MSLTQTLQKYISQSGIDYFENIIRESTRGRSDLNKLIDSFNKRIQTELDYAKNLEDGVSELITNTQQPECAVNLESIIVLYQREIQSKAKEQKKLAQYIKENIVAPLNSLLKEQISESRILISDGRKIQTQLKQEKSELEKLIAQFIQKNEDYHQHQIQKYSQDYLSYINPQKKAESTLKSDKLYRQLNEIRTKIKTQQQYYKQFVEGFDLRISKIIESLQIQDLKRVEVAKESLHQLFLDERIYENLKQIQPEFSLYKFKDQYIKNLDIDFQETKNFVQLTVIKTQDNWIENLNNFIIKKCQTIQCDRNQISFNMELLKLNYEQLLEMIQQQNKDLITSIQICQEMIHNEMQQLWQSNQINQNNLLNILSNNVIGKLIWINEFQLFRIEKKFELSESAYQNTACLLNNILFQCQEELDAYTIRKMILMTFTFYQQDKQQDKLFLSRAIEQNQVFQKQDMWDAIFFESLNEEMKNQYQMQKIENINDSTDREKNTIFGILGSLIQSMLSFNQQKQYAKILTQKYSKLYMLSDIHVKQLYSVIENFKHHI